MGLTRKQWAMLAVLVFGAFVAILNQTLTTPAQPSIMREMNIDASTVQWLTTGFTLVNAVMIPVTAYLTDRFTVKRLYLAAMTLFTCGALVVALSVNFPMLLAGRLVQAAGAGILMPMVSTVLLLTFPVERRGTAMGVFGIVMMLAPAIGPTLSGIVVDHVSWHILFFGVTALGAICIVAALIAIRREDKEVPAGLYLDKLSVVFSTLGFGGVLYGLSCIGSYGFSVQSAVSIAIGAIILVLFFRRQLHLDVPMLEVRILKTRKFAVATVIGMVVQASIMANGVLVPIYVQTLCGQSATVSGLVMLPGALIMGAMSPIAGRLFDKHGPRLMALVGSLLLLIGTVAMTTLTTVTPMVLLCVIVAVRNLAMSLINMPLNTWGLNALDNRYINHGNAVGNTFRQVAGSFGCAMVVSVFSLVSANAVEPGSIDAQMSGFTVAFMVQVVMVAAAVVLTFFMVKDKPGDVAVEDPNNERRSMLESIMHTDVYSVAETDTVRDGVRLLLERNISAAPVVNAAGQVTGFFSDGDVIRALEQRSQTAIDPITTILVSPQLNPDLEDKMKKVMAAPISSVANTKCISVDVHDSLASICRVMGENHLKKVPVTDNGKIIGIVNRSDIIARALRSCAE